MFPAEKQKAHEDHQKKISWVYYSTMVLGFWLIAGPPTFQYEVPAMVWNDILAGFALLLLSYLALNPYRLWAQWMIVFLGVWLFLAPVLFHVRDGAAFLNDYLIGTLIIAFAIIVARQPGIKLFAQPGPSIPPGWSYNPSSWSQRVPVIFLSWLGFFIARYMGAFQMELIDSVWDPIFGDGTRKVLTSEVSKSFPVSDAMLGAISYILDVVFAYAGGVHRWRTMPWVVIIFGILIIPLGVVSITLVILQPVSVGFWCMLCLTSATISLIMIPFTVDEVLATTQMIIAERKRGKSFWELFWFGGTMEGGKIAEKENPFTLLDDTFKSASKDLISRPWNLYLITAIGFWVAASPGILKFSGALANSCHIAGALTITFAIISMSEVARSLRFICGLIGLWIIASPWVLGYEQDFSMWSSLLSGVIIVAMAIRKGKIEDNRGNFEKYIV